MGARDENLVIEEEQALAFRARRGQLLGPGAGSPARAASALLGAQSQQLPPALFALSQRSKARPSASALRAALFGPRPTLVRTWGQRDTLFVFAPEDWSDVAAMASSDAASGRKGVMPTPAQLAKARKRALEANTPITRTHLADVPSASLLKEAAAKMGSAEKGRQLACGRLLWKLAHAGELCLVDKLEGEQAFVHRTRHFPRLAWPEQLDPRAAALRRVRAYLSAFAPASPTDVGHMLGARVSDAKQWLATLREANELIDVQCAGRKGLVALRADRSELAKAAPAKWPLRILPLWDSILMGHKDKRWLTPDPKDEARVWRKGAYVAASVLVRGRVVAVWTHKARAQQLELELEPLSGWSSKAHLPALKREAQALAAHLELPRAHVSLV